MLYDARIIGGVIPTTNTQVGLQYDTYAPVLAVEYVTYMTQKVPQICLFEISTPLAISSTLLHQVTSSPFPRTNLSKTTESHKSAAVAQSVIKPCTVTAPSISTCMNAPTLDGKRPASPAGDGFASSAGTDSSDIESLRQQLSADANDTAGTTDQEADMRLSQELGIIENDTSTTDVFCTNSDINIIFGDDASDFPNFMDDVDSADWTDAGINEIFDCDIPELTHVPHDVDAIDWNDVDNIFDGDIHNIIDANIDMDVMEETDGRQLEAVGFTSWNICRILGTSISENTACTDSD